jgi:hypothetical protein
MDPAASHTKQRSAGLYQTPADVPNSGCDLILQPPDRAAMDTVVARRLL